MTPRNAQRRLIPALAIAVLAARMRARAGRLRRATRPRARSCSTRTARRRPRPRTPSPSRRSRARPTPRRRARSASSGGPGTPGNGGAGGGVAQRPPRRACCAPTRPAPARASCRPSRSCPGERVAVSAVASAGQTHPASTTFTVAHPVSVSQKQFPTDPGNAARRAALQLRAVADAVDGRRSPRAAKPGASPGDLFLAPYQGDGTAGPMIAEQNGRLVWFHPLPAGRRRRTSRVQQYEGKPVLAWWQGRVLEIGFGQGEDVIYNTSYRQIATIRAGQRLPRRPARDPADAAGHRLDRRLLPDRDEPGARWAGRSDGVLSDSIVAGDRRQDRAW